MSSKETIKLQMMKGDIEEIELNEETFEKFYNEDILKLTLDRITVLKPLILDSGISLFVYSTGSKGNDIWIHTLNLFKYMFGIRKGFEYYYHSKRWVRIRSYTVDRTSEIPQKEPRFFDINDCFVTIPHFTEEDKIIISKFYLNEWTPNSIFAEYINLHKFEHLIQDIDEKSCLLQDLIDEFDFQKKYLATTYPRWNMDDFEERIKRPCFAQTR